MAKVNGTVSLLQDDEQIYRQLKVKGIKNSNKIVYKENDIHVTILMNHNTIEMNRKYSGYEIQMVFEENMIHKGKYFILELNKEIDLEIQTEQLYYDEKTIKIEYDLWIEKEKTGHFLFLLELEV